MKPLLTGIMAMLLLCITATVSAQQHNAEKRAVFQSNSDRIPVAVAQLEKAFEAKEGTEIKLQFREMSFEGTVISSVKKYENLHSVIVKNNRTNTLISFSKRLNEDKTITYVGRILNDSSTDGYELTKNADGTYTFHKIQTEDLIQDH